MEISLHNGAVWEFTLNVADADGAVDMTGKDLEFVMSTRGNTGIGTAATTGATGTITISGSALDVSIPVAGRPSLTIPADYLVAFGDLFDTSGSEPEWLGRKAFHILSGPALS
jgi:hypothetical protein